MRKVFLLSLYATMLLAMPPGRDLQSAGAPTTLSCEDREAVNDYQADPNTCNDIGAYEECAMERWTDHQEECWREEYKITTT